MKPDIILSLPAHPVPYAVVGSPINHSLSPVHAAGGVRPRRASRPATTASRPTTMALEQAVTRMRQVPFGGWNCTIPNKVRMYELCDRRAESAEQFRAVNTVVNENGMLVGHNTDGVGWSRALREAFGRGPGELRILLLGTGGAGRALATQAILEKCPELIVANRNPERAQELLDSPQRAVLLPDRSRARRRICAPSAGPSRNWRPRCAKSISSSTRPRPGSIPRRRRSFPRGSCPPSVLVFDTVYGAGCAKFRQEVETAGRAVERRPGHASAPGRGGLFALDRPGRAAGNHAAGAAQHGLRIGVDFSANYAVRIDHGLR